MQNPYQNYMKKASETMTPAERTAAVYDKCVTELNKAMYYIDEKDIPNAHKSIVKVQNIVEFLDQHLAAKYEMSEDFAKLYDYLRNNLILANVRKDNEIIKEILPLFENLRDSFTELSRRGM